MSSIFLICAGLVYLILGFEYNAGRISNPHLGFFPRSIGLLIVFFSLLLLLASFRKRDKEEKLCTVWEGLHGKNIFRATMVLGSVMVYLIVVEYVGFLVSSVPLVWFLAWVMGGRSWILNSILAVVSSVLLYWLFWIMMRIPIPLGSLWQ